MKKVLAILVAVVMVASMATLVAANSGQNPNQNPGSPTVALEGITVTATGGGNNLVLRATVDATGESVIIPRQGNGTFTQTFEAFGFTGIIQVQGNSLRNVTITSVPEVVAAFCFFLDEICAGTFCDECEYCLDCGDDCVCEDCHPAQPIEVALGFIGHYLHEGRVLTTSFYWQTLNAGDMIDWDAVEAAYAGWVARGGLAPDTTNGWQSSGFAPLFFVDGAEIGHGDFSFAQLEGYYRAYFVATGYILPTEEVEEEEIIEEEIVEEIEEEVCCGTCVDCRIAQGWCRPCANGNHQNCQGGRCNCKSTQHCR